MKFDELKKYKDGRVVKPRDPNWKQMQDLKKSGAAGSHGDKTKEIPRKAKYKDEFTNEDVQHLTELAFLPLLIPALATAVRIGAPHVLRFLGKKGAKEIIKKGAQSGAGAAANIAKNAKPLIQKGAEAAGKGAIKVAPKIAKGAGSVAKGVGKQILKHPIKATILGVGAKIYTEVDELFDHIKELVGDMLDNETIKALAQVAVKWALPATAIIAILYGGKKLYDYIQDEEEVELEEDMVVRIKNIKMPPNTGGEVPNSIIVNVPAGKDPKEVGRGILKRMTGKVPTSFDVVKETLKPVEDIQDESDENAPARLLGVAQAHLGYGLEMAQHVLDGDKFKAESMARVIVDGWPDAIDKIQNVYKIRKSNGEDINEFIDDRVGTVVKTSQGKRVKILQADPKEGVYKVELQNGDTKFMRRKDLDLEVPMDALGKNPIKRMWKHPWDSNTKESINDVFEKTDGAPTDLDDYKAKIKTLYSLERFMKDDPELASEVKRRYRQLAKWKINHDQAESYQSEIYNGLKDIGETATAGSTSAGAIATVANPVIAKHKPAKKGKFGAPKAPQKKKADGTAVNALDMSNNLMGGGAVKR